MKPHLFRLNGIWLCTIRHIRQKNISAVGSGFTALVAYRDWFREILK